MQVVSLQMGYNEVMAATNGDFTESAINVLLNFEIKEVQNL